MLDSSSCRSRKLSSPSVAIALHEAAHKAGSSDLHDLALHFMAVAGLPHLSGLEPDPVDAEAAATRPAIVCLERRAVARTADGSLVWAEGIGLPSLECGGIRVSDGEPAGECRWAYSLYLVDCGEGGRFRAEGIAVGDMVPIAEPRSRGNFRFPAIAQRFEGEVHQLHVAGGKLLSMGRAPEQAQRVASEVGLRGVWLAVGPQSKLIDALVSGHVQLWRRPLRERLSKLPEGLLAEWRLLDEPTGLSSLPPGWWLIRWAEEDRHPRGWTWFRYLAGAVRPGQFVPTAKPMAAALPESCVYQALPWGLRAQLHVEGTEVALFARGSAYDVAPLLADGGDGLRAGVGCSAVLDGFLSGPLSPRALRRKVSGREKIDPRGLTFAAFDCMFADGQDLHERPLEQRLEVLAGLPLRPPVSVLLPSDEPPSGCFLARDGRAPYPLTGEADTWMEVRSGHDKDDRRDEERPSEQGRSGGAEATGFARASAVAAPVQEEPARAWVAADGRVVQDDSFVRAVWLQPAAGAGTGGDVLLIEAPPARRTWLGLEFSATREPLWTALRRRAVPCRDLGAVGPVSDIGLGEEVEVGGRRWRMVSEGQAALGLQTHRLHEAFVFLEHEGRVRARLLVRKGQGGSESGLWQARVASTMTPAILLVDADALLASAEREGGWVAWNTECVRLLAAQEPGIGLPLNWEETISEVDSSDEDG